MNRIIQKGQKILKPNNTKVDHAIIIGGPDLAELKSKQEIIDAKVDEARIQAEEEAKKIIEKAEEEAQNLINQAHNQVQAISQKANEEGFQTGKSEGLQTIKNEMRNILETSSKILENIEKERQECLEDEEERVYQIIVAIAQKLIQKDLSLDKQISLNFIKASISALEHKSTVNLILEDETAKLLQECQEEILASQPGLNNLTITANSKLETGDVIIESNRERLDLRLTSQLEELVKEICKS